VLGGTRCVHVLRRVPLAAYTASRCAKRWRGLPFVDASVRPGVSQSELLLPHVQGRRDAFGPA